MLNIIPLITKNERKFRILEGYLKILVIGNFGYSSLSTIIIIRTFGDSSLSTIIRTFGDSTFSTIFRTLELLGKAV